jgi:hypothetical protein
VAVGVLVVSPLALTLQWVMPIYTMLIGSFKFEGCSLFDRKCGRPSRSRRFPPRLVVVVMDDNQSERSADLGTLVIGGAKFIERPRENITEQ